MKKLFLLIMIVIMSLSFVACDTSDSNDIDDGDYILTIEGILDTAVEVTKAEIMAMELVTLEDVYAQDKYEEGTGDYLYHTVKGVYLEDIIQEYVYADFNLLNYSEITAVSTDNYTVVVPQDYYSGENKPFIAVEYDGVTLSESDNSGALRMVINGSEAAGWAKMLSKLIFEEGDAVANTIDEIVFLSGMSVTEDKIMLADYVADIDTSFTSKMIGLDPDSDGGWTVFSVTRTNLSNYISNGYIDLSGEKAPVYRADEIPDGEQVSNLYSLELPSIVVINDTKLADYMATEEISFKDILSSYSMLCDFVITYYEGGECLTTKISVSISTEISVQSTAEGFAMIIDGVTYNNVEKLARSI